jgi:hypothetical protein
MAPRFSTADFQPAVPGGLTPLSLGKVLISSPLVYWARAIIFPSQRVGECQGYHFPPRVGESQDHQFFPSPLVGEGQGGGE